MKKKILTFEIIFIFCLILLLIKLIPYQYGVEDQVIYLPFIKKLINQNLYQDDYLFNYHSEASIFFKIIKVVYPLFNSLEKTFSFLYSLTLFFIFLGIYKFSQSLFNSRIISLITLLIFMFPKWVGGTGVLTYENYFLPRLLATPFLIFSLYFLINKKIKSSAMFALSSFIIHPVSAASLIIIIIFYLILKRKSFNRRDIISTLLIFFTATLIVILFAQKEFSQTTRYPIMSSQWLSIVKMRDPYIFPQLWKLRSFGSLILFYIFYLIFLAEIKILRIKNNPFDKDKMTIINLTAIISLLTPLLFIILSETIPITSVLQLEPARSLVVFAYLSIICFAYASYQIINSKNHFLVKFFIFIFLFFSVFLWNNKHPEKIDNEFIEVQKWVKDNTDINSIFLTPPFKKGFRIYSERSIIGEYKEGGHVLFSYNFAKEWKERIEILKKFDDFTEEDFKKIKEIYYYDYLVINNERNLHFTKVFNNSKYSVYRVF
ncbi:MAG: EpsG family protein [Candidatus Omnitrophica bacterium]|nr:EpsG family protein [Candidatus Omnitrophota bacterium]